MTLPGMFAPGGRTGLADVMGARPLVPKEWLKAHPLTRRFEAQSVRTNVGAAPINDVAIDLNDGFEGLIEFMVLRYKAGLQADNFGTSWALLVNRVPVWQTRNQFAASLDTAGRVEFMWAYDGNGNSWVMLDQPIEDNGVVEVQIINNGGDAGPMGWTMWGMYWPIGLRQEWLVRGWRK